MTLGLILFAASVVFSLVTLPVELNASRRAKELLVTHDILYPERNGGCQQGAQCSCVDLCCSGGAGDFDFVILRHNYEPATLAGDSRISSEIMALMWAVVRNCPLR